MRPAWHEWLDDSMGDANRVRLKIQSADFVSGDRVTFAETGVTVIVGANNAGKSSLLRLLNDALRERDMDVSRAKPYTLSSVERSLPMDLADLIRFFELNSKLIFDETRHEYGFRRKGAVFTEADLNQLLHGRPSFHGHTLYDQIVYFVNARNRFQFSLTTSARARTGDPAMEPLHRFQDERELFKELSSLSERVFGSPLYLDDMSGASISIRLGTVHRPLPARDEPLGEFGEELAALPLLEEQGDGMVSFFTLLIPLFADYFSTVLIDEPEAFLHPPQARALGKAIATVARERGTQVIAATHDKDFIAGVLAAGVPVTVVRLIRGATTHAVQLSPDRLREVWDDRALRYSNVLTGLFSKMVVVGEAEQDCRFYDAALDAFGDSLRAAGQQPALESDEALFVPSSGKTGVVPVIRALRDLKVPTAVILDIDALQGDDPIRTLVEESGGDWATVERSLRVIRSAVQDWKGVKRAGERYFAGQQRSELDSLVDALDQLGIFIVRVGELEGFASHHSKDRQWLPNALSEGAHAGSDARELMGRLLDFYSSTQSQTP